MRIDTTSWQKIALKIVSQIVLNMQMRQPAQNALTAICSLITDVLVLNLFQYLVVIKKIKMGIA